MNKLNNMDCSNSPRFDESIFSEEVLSSPADKEQLNTLTYVYDDYRDIDEFIDVFSLLEQAEERPVDGKLETTIEVETLPDKKQTDSSVQLVYHTVTEKVACMDPKRKSDCRCNSRIGYGISSKIRNSCVKKDWWNPYFYQHIMLRALKICSNPM